MKRLFKAYGELLGIIYGEAPIMVIMTFVVAILLGLATPLTVFVNKHIFDDGLAVAAGSLPFSQYVPYLVLFAIVSVLPGILSSVYIYNYVEKRSQLILRTAYKGRMLQKIKRMRYEHFESSRSMEIIDKAYNRADNSARHMFPMYVVNLIRNTIASVGTLYFIAAAEWWLLFTVLIPFAFEQYFIVKKNYNIYTEMEKYWKRERQYGMVAGYLRSREYVKELKINNAAGFLIDTYRDRLNSRNKEYEQYYFKHLRNSLLGSNITKISTMVNVVILLLLFIHGRMSVGIFIALSMQILGGLYSSLSSAIGFVKWSGFHINTFDYYDRYFSLSEENEGNETEFPESFDIEFKEVWFRYPGTETDILKGLSFTIKNGEKASIVGENGEGKTTMIKLLLGLFTPDRGEILVGGKPLDSYPLSLRTRIFGPVFQDFIKYSISLRENIGIGDVDCIEDEAKILAAACKGKVDRFAGELEKGYDALLGRDFEGGVDVSGGQWQRIAIARAFMGDKPILLLDEPTSQLDPMAESQLYSEFAEMAENKTAVFITHRLGSTMITDRIFVIKDGRVAETGNHQELMDIGGIYATMFSAQKQWYKQRRDENDGE